MFQFILSCFSGKQGKHIFLRLLIVNKIDETINLGKLKTLWIIVRSHKSSTETSPNHKYFRASIHDDQN